MAPLRIALSGDCIVNVRISRCEHPQFQKLIDVFRKADVAYTHLEGIIHDYSGPELYPAAEGGWVWMRTPMYASTELVWAGFDVVSTASNHVLDYSYGGLISTWRALDEAGIAHAGTGRTLSDARTPAIIERAGVRVALVSMCSSFPKWARAGDQRHDGLGRPGLNPLGCHHVVDVETATRVRNAAVALGWWITESERQIVVNPPGLHNTLYRFSVSDEPGIRLEADKDDLEANLRAIREAKYTSDIVIAHLHTHEWDLSTNSLSVPSEFVPPVARTCIDAGADIFFAQGSHAPLRGIEIYRGKPIFYDPGDFIKGSHLVDRHPSDFYARPDYGLVDVRLTASPSEGHAALIAAGSPLNPPEGYSRLPGSIVPVCDFDTDLVLREVMLIPYRHLDGSHAQGGLPIWVSGETAQTILGRVQELSEPFGTDILVEKDLGFIRPGSRRLIP